MKIFVTGATGFIGGHVVRQLRERGDDVKALVRAPAKAQDLAALGVELAPGAIDDRDHLARAMLGSDAVIHGAAIYEVGIPAGRRRALDKANVDGTRNVLGAALDAAIDRVVYISTVGAFGNTHGEVVDETYEHPGVEFTSHYEKTKYEAHRVALAMIAAGLDCVIVQPTAVFGPDDHSALGKQVLDFARGRMPVVPFPELGLNMVHVEDVAAGIVAALDKGRPGEAYVLGSQNTTMRGLMDTVADVAGKRKPLANVPTFLLKSIAPLGPLIGRVAGQPPNMHELISASDGVTLWASHEKAARDLGYEPRPLSDGLRQTLVAEGVLPGSGTASATS
ncbi:MAG: NAD-dependent epimerase/dehydratase family protein [Actinomycetota bacterium]|nr:NAD-dependent epimerase/dehydratase family protein [Actinomycetota bacterium]